MVDIAILQFFEGIRCSFLDAFFGVFSMLGEAMIVGGAAILVFWLAPKRAGEQIIMTALTSFPVNAFMKFTVHRPRPFVAGVVSYREPPFLADALEPDASFPSGHTQSSGSLFFSAAAAVRGIAVWIAAVCLVVLVMLSRLYFGAHYPSDVFTGFFLGLLISVLWALVFRFLHPYRYLLLLALAFLALFPCLLPEIPHDYVQAAGLLSGAAVALGAAHFCLPEHSAPFPRRLWRILIGGALVATAYVLGMLFPEGTAFSLAKWFFLAFTAGIIAPIFFEQLRI